MAGNGTTLQAAHGSALILAAGLAAAGWLLGDAVKAFKFADRYVTVKGLAEREVEADLAIWPLAFTVSANDLPALQAGIAKTTETVTAYLKLHGFSDSEISRSPPRITDHQAQTWGRDRPPERYLAERTITVQSGNVEAVLAAMAGAADLIGEGVVLANTYGPNAQFLFTGLNAIKPEMIAEATHNARLAAEQFARDSNSKTGAIRNANQGLFTIVERDNNSPEIKIVRVVSTVDFYLTD